MTRADNDPQEFTEKYCRPAWVAKRGLRQHRWCATTQRFETRAQARLLVDKMCSRVGMQPLMDVERLGVGSLLELIWLEGATYKDMLPPEGQEELQIRFVNEAGCVSGPMYRGHAGEEAMEARYVGRVSSWSRQPFSTSGTPHWQVAARAARTVTMNVTPAHRLLMWVLLSSAGD